MPIFASDIGIWIGIAFCVSQSALFSGMNLAMFSLSRLQLEVEVSSGNRAANKILLMRQDSNFLLTTILWGNVAINVLLTLLSDNVLAGITAFFFSTIVITIFGEILPQAYFSRNALRVAVLLAPVLRLYQFLLYPLAKPTALLLDSWLGKESIQYFREHNLRELLRKHIESPDARDIDRLEGLGALNFLTLDDLLVATQGVPIAPNSIVSVEWNGQIPVFPVFQADPTDPFLRSIETSGKKWVVLIDGDDEPRLVLDCDGFLRHVLFHPAETKPLEFCHQPIVVKSRRVRMGPVLSQLRYNTPGSSGVVKEKDVILLWDETKRVITGGDILGRLMQGVSN